MKEVDYNSCILVAAFILQMQKCQRPWANVTLKRTTLITAKISSITWRDYWVPRDRLRVTVGGDSVQTRWIIESSVLVRDADYVMYKGFEYVKRICKNYKRKIRLTEVSFIYILFEELHYVFAVCITYVYIRINAHR